MPVFTSVDFEHSGFRVDLPYLRDPVSQICLDFGATFSGSFRGRDYFNREIRRTWNGDAVEIELNGFVWQEYTNVWTQTDIVRERELDIRDDNATFPI